MSKKIITTLMAALLLCFIESDGKGAFRLLGMESAKTRVGRLFPSNWRNTQTGNWDVSFYDEFAIYDCRFWTYKQQLQKGDKYTLVLENDGKEIRVNVDKNKKGTRIIAIDGTEGEYELISSIALPGYPTKDTLATFKDTGYLTDTATLVGWLKDMPEKLKKRGDKYSVCYENIFIGNSVYCRGKLDSLGRFVVKIPLVNTTEVFMEWNSTFIRTVLEPGETYFLLYDFKGGHKLFMGNDARLQNEVLTLDIRWNIVAPDFRKMDKDAAMAYLDSIKREKEDAMEQLQKVIARHPTVSQRCINYLTGHYNIREGRNLMQGRFFMKDDTFPDEYMDYVNGQHWQQRLRPYTLYPEFSTFLRDFTDEHMQKRYAVKGSYQLAFLYEPDYSVLRQKRDNGEISITDEELEILFEYKRLEGKLLTIRKEHGFEALTRNSKTPEAKAIIKKYKAVMQREDVRRILEVVNPLEPLERTLTIADSLGCDKELREILITCQLYKLLCATRRPLNQTALQFFEQNVSMPAAKEFLYATQEKYLELERTEISTIMEIGR